MAKKRLPIEHRAFAHLEPGRDFPVFELAAEVGRVPAYDIPLADEQRERVERLLDELPIVSLHDHPVVFPADPTLTKQYHSTGRQHMAYEGLRQSRLDVVIDNLMDGMGCMTDGDPWRWEDIILELGIRLSDLAQQDQIIVARSVADIESARSHGQLALVIGMESSTPIDRDLDRIDALYGFGVRQLGISYNVANALGGGNRDGGDHGLTDFGRRAIERMNRLGMAIDISHSGDRTCLDTIAASADPVLITHAGSRTVWDTPRMILDEVIVACADRGGVIGIEAAPHSTLSAAHPHHSIDSVMDHVRYCIDLVGIDHVAFGPDTLFGDHVAVHDLYGFGANGWKSSTDFPRVPYVDGMENPAEVFPNVISWLVRAGYSDSDISKLVGENALRVLRQIWRH